MIHRRLAFQATIITFVLCGWSPWGEAHRSGCHRWHTCLPHHDEFSGQVVAITDGDTVHVKHEGQTEKIRLAGVDAPEAQQTFGLQAQQFTSELALGQEVIVRITGHHWDRAVGEVLLPDGRNLNRELVMAGLAWWCQKYSRDETLAQIEKKAQETQQGLWTDSHPMPPWEFRTPREPRPCL